MRKYDTYEEMLKGEDAHIRSLAKCPNPNCDGIDATYFVDDCIPHECDKCGTKWKSYDPRNKLDSCFDILIP